MIDEAVWYDCIIDYTYLVCLQSERFPMSLTGSRDWFNYVIIGAKNKVITTLRSENYNIII